MNSNEKCRCCCGFTTQLLKDFRTHIDFQHSCDNMLWVCSTCGKKLEDYQKVYDHIRKVHKCLQNSMAVSTEMRESEVSAEQEPVEFEIPESCMQEEQNDSLNDSPSPDSQISSECKIRSLILQMASMLTGKYKVCEDALNYMFKTLCEIEKLRKETGSDPVFQEFSTTFRRNKFMVAEGGLVLPKKVKVCTKKVINKEGRYVEEPVWAYIVPLENSLRNLLRNKFVLEAIQQSPMSTSADYSCDREVGLAGSSILQIKLGLSIDDVEFCVPIGQAKIKNKQTIMSFHVLNLPVKWRSKNESKQLLFICNANVFNKQERADNVLLEDLKSVIKKSEHGILLVEGSKQLFRVTFEMVTADAEALSSLLKMKRTGEKTKRPCWCCNIQSHELAAVLDVDGLVNRDVESHRKDCEYVEDEPFNKKKRMESSMSTGVTGQSALLDIPGFEFSKVCFDVMHCVLEGGMLELRLRDFIRVLVQSGIISLCELNTRIRNWKFDLQSGDVRPPEIPDRVLTGGALGLKAKTCLTLAENISLIVRDKRELAKEDFRQFARCLRISQGLLEAPLWPELNLEIFTHQYVKFIAVRRAKYGWATMTPKLHFLLHLREQILKHRPSRNDSCMQWERKYKIFRAKKLYCFKNVSYTMAMYHQKWLAASLFVIEDGRLRGQSFEDEIIGGRKCQSEDVDEAAMNSFSAEILTAEKYTTVTCGSVKYKAGDILDLGPVEQREPKFAQIQYFLKTGTAWNVIVRKISAEKFDNELGRFVGKAAGLDLISFTDLEYPFVQPSFKDGETFYICRKYTSALELI